MAGSEEGGGRPTRPGRRALRGGGAARPSGAGVGCGCGGRGLEDGRGRGGCRPPPPSARRWGERGRGDKGRRWRWLEVDGELEIDGRCAGGDGLQRGGIDRVSE